jgi:predicted nucleotidyltransferase
VRFEPLQLLRVLANGGVDFIVVGGVAAAIHGAPVVTQDLDVLYRLEAGNLTRLKAVLDALGAVARGDPRGLPFGLSHLETRGHKLTMTKLGALDVLGSVNEDLTYDELLPWAQEVQLREVRFKVLTLPKLIELKRSLGRPKDLAVLAVLESTLKATVSGR